MLWRVRRREFERTCQIQVFDKECCVTNVFQILPIPLTLFLGMKITVPCHVTFVNQRKKKKNIIYVAISYARIITMITYKITSHINGT